MPAAAVESVLWEGIFKQTRGLLQGVFNPQVLQGWVFTQHNVMPREISSLLQEQRFWRSFGVNLLQLTPAGTLELLRRFGRPKCNPQPSQPSPAKAPEPSLTERWVKEHALKFTAFARGYLTKKLPVSARTGQIDDHIQDWLTLAIERDYLRKPYEAHGGAIPYGIPALFIFRHASAGLRRTGRNPACRAIFGALAPQEIAARRKRLNTTTSPMEETFVEYRSANRPVLPEGDPLGGIVDQGPSIEEILDLQSDGEVPVELITERLTSILGRSYHGILGQAILLDWQELRLTVDNCATKHHVPPSTIRSARSALRNSIRGDRDLADLYLQTMALS